MYIYLFWKTKNSPRIFVVCQSQKKKVLNIFLKIPKRYLLTTLKEDGYYEPMTDAEFEQFKLENPALAKYFETTEDDEDVTPIS